MRLIETELLVLGLSYLLASLPIGGIVLAGRISPLYQRSRHEYLRWWSWGALLIVAAALLVAAI